MPKLGILQYIEGFYHAKRIHSKLGNRTPNEIEIFYTKKEVLVA